MQAITNLFEESVKKYPNNIYLWEKKIDKYQGTTYSETRDLVYKFAAGLISIGIKKGDRIAILSEGRNEWVISELGLLYAGAISVPLAVKLTETDEISFRLEHSGAKYIICSQNQARKLDSLLNTPIIDKVILFDDKETYHTKEISFTNVLNIGKNYLAEHYDEFNKIWQSVLPSDAANICYTSGTTADPKGIILTHRNYTANAEQGGSMHVVPQYYVTLLILPWDHSFAHTCGIYTMMRSGASIASVQSGKTPMETLKNIPVNIKEVQPHFILSVPALAKNFKKNIEAGVAASGKVAELLLKAGLSVGYAYNGIGYNKGKGLRALLKPINKLFDIILFSKIRQNFGGRLQFFVGGGALLDIELQRFFGAIGLPMLQGYGLTEAAPVISSNNLAKYKYGTSGPIPLSITLKICDDKGNELPLGAKGEIVIKGENVMAGYWNNPEATEQTIKNGWLHTGDMGYLDADGFLYVTGRFKSLLIADDGEKYSPEGIEEAFIAQSNCIEQCMLYNNQNPYTVALIYPNKEGLKRWLREKHLNANTVEANNAALKHIEAEINEYRAGKKYGNMFPQRWLPPAIAILSEGFTEDNHQLNSTLKMVRGKITEFYAERIKYLYTAEAKDICNSQNIEAIAKIIS